VYDTGTWSVSGNDITLNDTSPHFAELPPIEETFSINENGNNITLTYKGLNQVSFIFIIFSSMEKSLTITRQSGGNGGDGECPECGNDPCTCDNNSSNKTPFYARQVSTGWRHTVAIKTDGSLWAWGDWGQLGGESSNDSKYTPPTRIGSDYNWVSVSNTVAIKTDGSLWAWGGNYYYGLLGDGSNDSNYTPTRIGSDYNWASVSAENTTVAIKTDGSLLAWGMNDFGQLGDGTNDDKNTPTRIGADYNWVSVSAGYAHTVAIKTDGSLWAWGYNFSGQLGDGTNDDKNTPTRIGADYNWVSVSAGDFHTVAIKTDGSLWAWGSNYDGRLGDGTNGTNDNKNTPTRIGADYNWESVSAGYAHTVAIKTDGSLWAWGYNEYGQLGDGTNFSKNTPTQIGADYNWVSMFAGRSHTVAIKTDGSLWAWGENFGRLGDGTSTNKAPVQVFIIE